MSGPNNYPQGQPPQQGYDQGYEQPYNPPPPGNGYYNDSQYRGHNSAQSPQHASYDPHTGYPVPPGFVPPHKPPPSSGYDPNNFPPPPRQEYPDDGYSEYDHHYDRAPPSDYGTMPPAHSGYGNDGRQYDGAIEPYDENKARAEYDRAWEQQQRQQQEQQRHYPPPPPSDEELRRRRGYDGRYDDRYEDEYDDRYYDYRDRRSGYDDRSSYDDRDRRYDDRDRRRRRDSAKSPTKSNGKDIFGGREGERGFGAQLLGAAAGGIAGHELGGGLLETIGGAVAGGIGAKILENQHEKRKSRKEEEKRAGAPYKHDMAPRDRTIQPAENWPRDDRGDIKRERRRSMRRSDSDSYSSDGSPPPRRR